MKPIIDLERLSEVFRKKERDILGQGQWKFLSCSFKLLFNCDFMLDSSKYLFNLIQEISEFKIDFTKLIPNLSI